MPETESMEKLRSDWRVALMVKVNEWLQHNPSLFIPLVQSWNQDDPENLQVYTLRKVLQIDKKDDLPHLFVYHAKSDTTFRYPEPLDDIQKFSPLVVMYWAQLTVIEKEVAMLKQRLVDHEKNPEGEETKLSERKIKEIKELVAKLTSDAQELTGLLAKEKEALVDKNPFAEFVAKAFAKDEPKVSAAA